MIVDSNGAMRHLLPRNIIQELYTKFDNFVADLTHDEYYKHFDAICAIRTLMHQREREANS